jgi:spore coat protein U-like protein
MRDVFYRYVLAAAFVTALLGVAPIEQARADITGCSMLSGGIAFSDYDLLTQDAVANYGDLDVTCTGTGSGVNNVVTVDLGSGPGSCMTRTLTKVGSTLDYNIYTDSNHTSVWCAPTTQPYEFIFGASPQTHSFRMYGQTAAGQAVAPGAYSATVPVSITWPGGGSTSGDFLVTQSAPATCSVSASAMNFGNYAGAATNATATLTITCSLNSSYNVSLGGGENLSGTTRRMAGPATSLIGFNLYSDAAHTTSWGDDTALGAVVSGTGSGSAQPLTVYGRTTAGALPVPGSYSDTVVVTVTY